MIRGHKTQGNERPRESSKLELKRSLGAGGLTLLGYFFARRQERVDHPMIAISRPRTESIRKLALSLSAGEPSDEKAVRKLKNAARRHVHNLRQAIALIRMNGYPNDFRVLDRAIRLLESAASGDGVRPLSAQEEELFGLIDDLYSLSIEEAYERLKDAVPGLGPLEGQIVESLAMGHDDDILWDELFAGLKLLLGGEADVKDPLLRTNGAHNIARLYIARKVGLIDAILND